MTDLKFSILEICYSTNINREVQIIDLLNRGLQDPVVVSYAVEELEIQGFIKSSSQKVRLTSDGAIAFESEKEIREKIAEEKRNHSKNQRYTIISLVISFLSFLAGFLFDLITDVILNLS